MFPWKMVPLGCKNTELEHVFKHCIADFGCVFSFEARGKLFCCIRKY
uniref:Uncharacterized protein n=1 Tax=Anguilla anguilla TaxID=7936 RepID=A0A0E9US60_ANGAN